MIKDVKHCRYNIWKCISEGVQGHILGFRKEKIVLPASSLPTSTMLWSPFFSHTGGIKSVTGHCIMTGNTKNGCQYLLRPKYHVTHYITQDYLIQWWLEEGDFISSTLNKHCTLKQHHHTGWAQQSFKYAGHCHCHILDGSSCYFILTLPNTPCTRPGPSSYLTATSLQAE
jgi:hypothetical protein